jgi:hypothetical protein
MNVQENIIQRFHVALPRVRLWIDEYLERHRDQARTVHSLGFERLAHCFPEELLQSTKVVEVARVQFPPVERFGLPEFAPMQQMQFAGITFKDTFFLQKDQLSESLHFHELVHIVQWARLGVDNFLLAYGLGFIMGGYEQSPLEQMASTLQRGFEGGTLPQQLVRDIEERADAIWQEAAPILQGEHMNGLGDR